MSHFHSRGALPVGPDGSVRTPILPAQQAPLCISPSPSQSPTGGFRLIANGDFDAYWHYHARREYQRTYASRYQQVAEAGAHPSP